MMVTFANTAANTYTNSNPSLAANSTHDITTNSLTNKKLCYRCILQLSSVNQTTTYYRVVQVIKSLQDPLEVGDNLTGINDNVGERGLEQKCLDADGRSTATGQIITMAGRLYQMVGPATGKARPPTTLVSRTVPADDWSEHSQNLMPLADLGFFFI